VTYTETLTPRQLRELYQYYGEMPACVWPGGYPLVYMYDLPDERETVDVCARCANDAENGVSDSLDNVGGRVRLAGAYIHYEGVAVTCSHCGAEVESAYGEVAQEPNGQLVNGIDY
jgi:hypothetical protein